MEEQSVANIMAVSWTGSTAIRGINDHLAFGEEENAVPPLFRLRIAPPSAFDLPP